ncbi:MAG: hypothetical protein ABW252_19485 [Polyangiales bacterium]
MLGALALIAGCGGSDGAEAPDPDASRAPPPTALADASLDASAVDASVDAGPPAPVDAGESSRGDGAVPVSCPVDPPTSCPDAGAPRYADVAPIVQRRCESCHSPFWSGPWPLHTVGHLRDWADDVRTNLINCTMPPPDAGVPITKDERLTLLQWVRCGLPD